jgi:hypothetical protein
MCVLLCSQGSTFCGDLSCMATWPMTPFTHWHFTRRWGRCLSWFTTFWDSSAAPWGSTGTSLATLGRSSRWAIHRCLETDIPFLAGTSLAVLWWLDSPGSGSAVHVYMGRKIDRLDSPGSGSVVHVDIGRKIDRLNSSGSAVHVDVGRKIGRLLREEFGLLVRDN